MQQQLLYKHHSELGISKEQRERLIQLMGRLERGEVRDYCQPDWGRCIASQCEYFSFWELGGIIGWWNDNAAPTVKVLNRLPRPLWMLFCCNSADDTQQQAALAIHYFLLGKSDPWEEAKRPGQSFSRGQSQQRGEFLRA
jgi:hypothetical protein